MAACSKRIRLVGAALLLVATSATAQAAQTAPSTAQAARLALLIKPLAEAKVGELPAGTLFWRIENFDTIERARAAAGLHSLAVEALSLIHI